MDKMTSWIWLQFFGKASRISFREKSPSAYPRNSSLQEAKRLTGKNCSIFLLMRCPSCSVMPLHWVFKSINLRKSNICIHPVCWKIVRSSSYASAWTIMGHLVEVVGWWLAHTPCLGVKKWQLQPHRTIFLGNGVGSGPPFFTPDPPATKHDGFNEARATLILRTSKGNSNQLQVWSVMEKWHLISPIAPILDSMFILAPGFCAVSVDLHPWDIWCL